MPSFLPAILFQWLGALYPLAHSPPTFMSCQPWPSSEMAASGSATSCAAASSSKAPSLVSSGLASSGLASYDSVSFGISCTGWLFWVLWSLVPWFCGSLCSGVRFGGWWVWRQWVLKCCIRWRRVWQLTGSSSIRYTIPMLLNPRVSPRLQNAMQAKPDVGGSVRCICLQMQLSMNSKN